MIIAILLVLMFATGVYAETTTVVVGDLYNITDDRVVFNKELKVRIADTDSPNTASLHVGEGIAVKGFMGKPVNFTVTPVEGAGDLPTGYYDVYVMYTKDGLLSHYYSFETCYITSPGYGCLVEWQHVDDTVEQYVIAFSYSETGKACSFDVSALSNSFIIHNQDCVLRYYISYYTGHVMSFRDTDLTITNDFRQFFIVNDGCDSSGMTFGSTPPIGRLCWNYYGTVFIGGWVSVRAYNGIESVYIGENANFYGGGHYNVAVGFNSFIVNGQENHYNVAIGHQAMGTYPYKSYSNSIAIGANANFTTDVIRKLNIGNTILGSTRDTPPLDMADYLSNTMTVYGSQGHKIDTITSSTTLTEEDNVILCDASSATVTITLPLANTAKGREYKIKKIDSSANACTITASGTDLIDGSSSMSLSSQYDYVTLISDGVSNWYKF